MGSLFKTAKVGTQSSVGYDQLLLQSPLSQFYQNQFGDDTGVNQINKLLSGDSEFVNSTGKEIYNRALLGPSMRDFERVTRPGIENSFANLGGTLSSRRVKALTDAKTDLIANAQSTFSQQVLPQLMDTALAGIMSGDSLKYSAADLASAFAVQNTMSQAQRQAGPGWGLLGSVLGSAASFLG